MPRSQEGLARLIDEEGLANGRIAQAFRAIDRADFVPDDLRGDAYLDRPVAIPHRQTTSQPSLIARMIDAAGIEPEDRVLEVGTGYGFQTALIASVAKEVVSVELFPSLAETARRNLAHAGVTNAEVVVGDGWQGASGREPFDAVIVSAVADELPSALVEQLDEGGRLVIPLKARSSDDVLLFQKRDGKPIQQKLVTPARFVPLVRSESR
jgi:protein-L-isoaspartate(D-aspartate) O-methyltransferase